MHERRRESIYYSTTHHHPVQCNVITHTTDIMSRLANDGIALYHTQNAQSEDKSAFQEEDSPFRIYRVSVQLRRVYRRNMLHNRTVHSAAE